MAKKELLIITNYTQDNSLTLDELCEICHISADFLEDLIKYEIIHPAGNNPHQWLFDLDQLNRIKKAIRLQHDLEVNLAGVAVVLDLLDQLEELRAKEAFIEKHFFKS